MATIDSLQESWAIAESKIQSGNYSAAQVEQFKEDQKSYHDQAEAIRSNYGYSGGDDGSHIIVTDEKKARRTFSNRDARSVVNVIESSSSGNNNTYEAPAPSAQGGTAYVTPDPATIAAAGTQAVQQIYDSGTAAISAAGGLGSVSPQFIIAGILMFIFLMRR